MTTRGINVDGRQCDGMGTNVRECLVADSRKMACRISIDVNILEAKAWCCGRR